MPKNPRKISEKITDIYEKYAPRNISLQQFAEMIEQDPSLLDSINGEFSTVNPELAKIFRVNRATNISDDDFRIKLKDSINLEALEHVVTKYADMCETIIAENENILWGALTYEILNRQQRQALAINIIDSVNKYFGITDKISVKYIDKKNQRPFGHLVLDFIRTILIKLSNKIDGTNYSKIDWIGYQSGKKIILFKNRGFLDFMGTLIHEYGHFIDYNYPNLGGLGAQISFYGRKVYSSLEGAEVYHTNPTEVSSERIEEIAQQKIYDAIVKQIQRRPELYVKSIRTILNYKEMQLSALRIKCKDMLNACEKAKQEYQNLKNKILLEQHPDCKDLSPIEIASIVHSVNQMPEVVTLRNKYQQIQAKIPDEVTRLEADIRHFEWILKQYDSDREFLMSQVGLFMDGMALG